MGRGPLPMRKPKLPLPVRTCGRGAHPVLARVSSGCPGHRGRLPTCYSPVRGFCPRASPGSSLHLHVLGTPPAFVLSQDQTLRESDSRVSSAVPGQGEPAAPLSSLESCHASVCAAEYTDRRRHDRVVCPSPAQRRPEGRRGTEVPVRPATGRTCRGHGPTDPRLARCSVFKDRITQGRRDAPPTHEPPRRRPPSIAANGGPLQARDRWGAAV
jgi:hypothetical protein